MIKKLLFILPLLSASATYFDQNMFTKKRDTSLHSYLKQNTQMRFLKENKYYFDTRKSLNKLIEDSKVSFKVSGTLFKDKSFNEKDHGARLKYTKAEGSLPILKFTNKAIQFGTQGMSYKRHEKKDDALSKTKIYLNNCAFSNEYYRLKSLQTMVSDEALKRELKYKKMNLKMSNESNIYDFMYAFNDKPSTVRLQYNFNPELCNMKIGMFLNYVNKHNLELQSKRQNIASKVLDYISWFDVSIGFSSEYKKKDGDKAAHWTQEYGTFKYSINPLEIITIGEKANTQRVEYMDLQFKINHKAKYAFKKYQIDIEGFMKKSFDSQFHSLVSKYKQGTIKEQEFVSEYYKLVDAESKYLKAEYKLAASQADLMNMMNGLDRFVKA